MTKINVGAGRKVLDGWINVDAVASPLAKRPPEILSDAKRIPLEDGIADELMAIHLLEHFYYWEVPEALTEWMRLLKSGGKLVLELPNIAKCARNFIDGLSDQMTMWGFYGDPRDKDPYMAHRWGWTPETLIAQLKAIGFHKIKEEQTEWHSVGRDNRDMRIVAFKP